MSTSIQAPPSIQQRKPPTLLPTPGSPFIDLKAEEEKTKKLNGQNTSPLAVAGVILTGAAMLGATLYFNQLFTTWITKAIGGFRGASDDSVDGFTE
jgi:hypothetical protein